MVSLFDQISGRDGSESQQCSDAQNRAKALQKRCNNEIETIKLCGDCYMNANQPSSFTFVCSKPHLLLWVMYGEYPIWPAKLLAARKGRKPLKVQFFGDHTSAEVTYKDCFLFSKEDPNEWFTNRDNELFQKAMDVSSFQFN